MALAPSTPRILIAGAYGTFGRLLARELLASTQAHLVLAGRRLDRAAALCHALDAGHRVTPLALDLSDRRQFAEAARGCFAIACAAGPFQNLDPALPRIAADNGAHWLDIADHPAWIAALLRDQTLATAAGDADIAVLPGQSTVPALSGALARWCLDRVPAARSVRVTLFIGNRNSKGTGAVTSVLESGLNQPEPVDLPIGRRTAYRLGAAATLHTLPVPVDLRVTFEWEPVGRLLASASRLAARLGAPTRARLTRALVALAAPLNHFGSSGGCLQAETWDHAGQRTLAALLDDTQRLAILPCALAIEALLNGTLRQRGVLRPSDWLSPEEWIARLGARGIWLVHS